VTLTTQNLGARPSAPQQPGQSDSGFSQGSEPVSFTYTGLVKLQRPNLERIELLDPIHQTIACDGAAFWTLLQTNEYIKNPADPQGKNPIAYGPILMFFAPEVARTAGTLPMPGVDITGNYATRYLGKERVVLKIAHSKQDPPGTSTAKETAPEEFEVVEVRQLRPTEQAVKVYINADGLVTRVVSEVRRGGVSTIQDVALLNVRPAQKFDPSEFAFELPPGARPYEFKAAPPRK
jgi:outer membrane lipoprotein-sorting protein